MTCVAVGVAGADASPTRAATRAEAATAAPDTAAIAIQSLVDAGEFASAGTRARALLQQREHTLGPEAPAVADAIDLLVNALRLGRKEGLPEALALAERALAIREQHPGTDAVGHAQSLNNLGLVLYAMDRLDEARARLEQALVIRERVLGKNHLDVAMSLNGLGNVLQDSGDLTPATACYQRALDIRIKAVGERHKLPAFTMSNLAIVLRKQGRFDEARALYRRALGILDSVLAPDDPQLAGAIGNLAPLEARLGGYDEARTLYERLVTLRAATLGERDPRVAQALAHLGDVCRVLGDPDAARAALERALDIVDGGKPDPKAQATALNNLANLYESTGDIARARPLYERALRLRQAAYGEQSPQLAQSYSNLANVVAGLGDRRQGKALLARSLGIQRAAVAESEAGERAAAEADLAVILNNLARLEVDADSCATAAPLLEEARALQERLFPEGHPNLAETLSNQATCLERAGDGAGAEANWRRALELREQAFGPQHPRVALGAERLAAFLLRRAQGQSGAARARDAREGFDLALRAEQVGREHLRLAARVQAEREALRYAAERVAGLDLALATCARAPLASAAMAQGGKEPALPLARAFDQVIRARALVLDEFSARQQSATRADDPRVREAAAALAAARRRLAGLLVRGAAGEEARAHRQALDAAREQQETCERRLADQSASYRQERAASGAGLAQVAAALPRDTALLAYARFRDVLDSPATVEADAAMRYFAFVLRGGEQAPQGVALGSDVDALAQQWRTAVGSAQANDGAGDNAADALAAEENCARLGDRLRGAVWDPVVPLLRDAGRVLVVPDGALHLVNLAALPQPGSADHRTLPISYLIESGPVLHVLSAERDVVTAREWRTRHAAGTGGGGLLVVGNPAFDAAPGPSGAIAEGASASSTATSTEATATVRGDRTRGAATDCPDFATMRFEPLSASAAEVDALAALWSAVRPRDRVTRLRDRAASEASVGREVRGRRVVHLATHGFFLEGECVGTPGAGPPASGGDLRGIGAVRRKGAPAAASPLLLSGLALAGANLRAQTVPGRDDGVLTAEEIAGLDLQGVDWAVLSACDTGIGQVQAGEGVLGLRRALRLAGAHTVILSLWPVRDQDARSWMDVLYRERLERGAATAEAVQAASRATLRALRAAGQPTPPGRWAAFVAEGDWR